MVPPASHKVPRVSWYSGYASSKSVLTYATLTRYGGYFPLPLLLTYWSHVASTTPENRSFLVWPLPLSLATTHGISFDFSSWGYLDVSVHPVFPRLPMYSVNAK